MKNNMRILMLGVLVTCMAGFSNTTCYAVQGRGLGGGIGDSLDAYDASQSRRDARNQKQRLTLTLKLYKIDDLISPSGDTPFKGFVLPGLSSSKSLTPAQRQSSTSGYGGGGGGFGGGGFGGGGRLGGGGGGGVFSIPSSAPQGFGGLGGGLGGLGNAISGSNVVTADAIIGAIETCIEPDSWQDTGTGHGTIASLGNVLVIQQTSEVHSKIDAFLASVRETLKPKTTVTIKAIWLTLTEDQFLSLDIEKDQQVNSRVLAELVKTSGKRAQVTCFDGQTTHVAAGNLKSTVESMIPVVGQNETNLAPSLQLAKSTQATIRTVSNPTPERTMVQAIGKSDSSLQTPSGSVGYQPISRWVNYGAVLGVTPKVDQDKKMLTVDVANVLITKTNERTSTKQINGLLPLDQHDLNCQQFNSRVRLKDSTPTLIGGTAFLGGENGQQTYLILEAVVNGRAIAPH